MELDLRLFYKCLAGRASSLRPQQQKQHCPQETEQYSAGYTHDYLFVQIFFDGECSWVLRSHESHISEVLRRAVGFARCTLRISKMYYYCQSAAVLLSVASHACRKIFLYLTEWTAIFNPGRPGIPCLQSDYA